MSFPVELVLCEQLVDVYLLLPDLGGQFLDPHHFKKYVPDVQLLNTNAASFNKGSRYRHTVATNGKVGIIQATIV